MSLKEKLLSYKVGNKLDRKAENTASSAPVTDDIYDIKNVSSFEFENFIFELFSSLNVDAMVETILIYLMSNFSVNKVAIFFLDEDNNIYTPIGIKGVEDFEDVKIDFDSYLLKLLNSPIFFNDIKDEPGIGNDITILQNNGFEVIIPLIHQNEKVGFVLLGNKNSGEKVAKSETDMLMNAGNIIANALYNAIFIDKQKAKYEELSLDYKNMLTLIETLKNIQLAENIDEALKLFFNILNDIYKITAANLLLKDPASNVFRVIKSIGLSDETEEKFEIASNEDIIGDLIDIGEPMMVPDFTEMSLYKEKISDTDKEKIKFFYTVPIKFGNECIGIFNVFNIDMEIEEELPAWLERDLSYLPLSILPYLVNEFK